MSSFQKVLLSIPILLGVAVHLCILWIIVFWLPPLQFYGASGFVSWGLLSAGIWGGLIAVIAPWLMRQKIEIGPDDIIDVLVSSIVLLLIYTLITIIFTNLALIPFSSLLLMATGHLQFDLSFLLLMLFYASISIVAFWLGHRKI